jgi:hypothetical protein
LGYFIVGGIASGASELARISFFFVVILGPGHGRKRPRRLEVTLRSSSFLDDLSR